MVRRQKKFYFIGALLGALLLINVLFFLIVFNKARSEYSRLQASVEAEESLKKIRTATVESLQKTADVLESFPSDRMEFLTRHLVSRQTGFADVLRTVDRMVVNSGVRKTRVEYTTPTAIPQYGLHEVQIKIPVQGDYASIFRFIKELQTAPTVFIITAVDVHGGTTSEEVEEATTISLTLAMETYFYDEPS
ncbi:MAG TPA: type 4a pilus biogenesis protein PilO [Terriglobia bacterium]|nr:type 4a pilus biogenesis protein PilO [Terriglobia bacterium]